MANFKKWDSFTSSIVSFMPPSSIDQEIVEGAEQFREESNFLVEETAILSPDSMFKTKKLVDSQET